MIYRGRCCFPPPYKKLLTHNNSGGSISGAIAILHNQLRQRTPRELFSRELRKFRVAQHGESVASAATNYTKSFSGSQFPMKLHHFAVVAPENDINIFWANFFRNVSGKEKHININKFAGLSRDWVGAENLFMCFFSGHSLWGRKNT